MHHVTPMGLLPIQKFLNASGFIPLFLFSLTRKSGAIFRFLRDCAMLSGNGGDSVVRQRHYGTAGIENQAKNT